MCGLGGTVGREDGVKALPTHSPNNILHPAWAWAAPMRERWLEMATPPEDHRSGRVASCDNGKRHGMIYIQSWRGRMLTCTPGPSLRVQRSVISILQRTGNRAGQRQVEVQGESPGPCGWGRWRGAGRERREDCSRSFHTGKSQRTPFYFLLEKDKGRHGF